MFFRIVQDGHVTTFDCKKAEWHPQGFDDNGNMTGHVIIDEGKPSENAIGFYFKEANPPKKLELILMNNDGKTIDRFILTK